MTPPPAAPVPDVDRAIAVARSSLGRYAPWLLVDEARPAAWSSEAVTLAELLAADGTGIDRVLRVWDEVGLDEPGGAPAVLGAVAWTLFHPQLVAVREARQLITVDVGAARVDIVGGHDDPTRVWWRSDTVVQQIGVDDHEVEAAYRFLVEQAVTALAPLVECVRTKVSIGRRGLWAHVVDTFNGVGPRYLDPDPDRLSAELALVERARTGTPLAQRAVVVDIERHDGCRRTVRTSACCLAYLSPHRSAPAKPRPWDEGPWAGYCMSCPLIPVEETIARATYWLDDDDS